MLLICKSKHIYNSFKLKSRLKIYLIQSLGREDSPEEGGQPAPVFLPGKSYGQRSLADYSPWGHQELDMTELLIIYNTNLKTLLHKENIFNFGCGTLQWTFHFICDLLNIFSRLQLSVSCSFVWMPNHNVHVKVFCGLMFILNHMHLFSCW